MKRKREEDWKRIWDGILDLRQIRDSPIDILGCDKLTDKSAPKEVSDFQTLIAAMLSSQTKDEKTAAAMVALKTLPGGLTIDSIIAETEESIVSVIYGVSFHKQKAANIKKAAVKLREEYDGVLPDKFDELLKFPGVGPKMANLVLNCAFNKQSGICVDSHVHRLCGKLGWGCRKCKDCREPEHTRLALEGWLPHDLWGEFTVVLVGLGQLMQRGKGKLNERIEMTADPDFSRRLLDMLK